VYTTSRNDLFSDYPRRVQISHFSFLFSHICDPVLLWKCSFGSGLLQATCVLFRIFILLLLQIALLLIHHHLNSNLRTIDLKGILLSLYKKGSILTMTRLLHVKRLEINKGKQTIFDEYIEYMQYSWMVSWHLTSFADVDWKDILEQYITTLAKLSTPSAWIF